MTLGSVSTLGALTLYLPIPLLMIRGSMEGFCSAAGFPLRVPGWDKLSMMSLSLSYKVDVITILEITVRLWGTKYQACSLSLSVSLCLT